MGELDEDWAGGPVGPNLIYHLGIWCWISKHAFVMKDTSFKLNILLKSVWRSMSSRSVWRRIRTGRGNVWIFCTGFILLWYVLLIGTFSWMQWNLRKRRVVLGYFYCWNTYQINMIKGLSSGHNKLYQVRVCHGMDIRSDLLFHIL